RAGGGLVPLALALAGADYLAPRNLVAAMIPLTALVAVLLAGATSARRAPRGRADTDAAPGAHARADPLSDLALVSIALTAVIVVAFAAVCIDVSLSPRLQRGNWRGVARALRPLRADTAISTVELASAPLEYYLGCVRK